MLKRATMTYHIYLEDKCLFKDLNQEEFDIIWGRIYRSYLQSPSPTRCVKEMYVLRNRLSNGK